MSKQQDYQQLNTKVPNAEDYGFAARFPHAGASCPIHGAYHANLGANCTCGAAGGTPMAYPAATYAGAHLVGYPAGMVLQDPLGRCGKKRARRMGAMAAETAAAVTGAVAAGEVQCICCLVWRAPPSTQRRTTTGTSLPRPHTSPLHQIPRLN